MRGMGRDDECGSSEIMTPLNVSVKMSPHEKGDSYIEREGTATVVSTEQDHAKGNHRRGGSHAHRGFCASTTKTAGSVPGGGSDIHAVDLVPSDVIVNPLDPWTHLVQHPVGLL